MNTDKLNKCIELFDSLTPAEKLIVVDNTCFKCGEDFNDCYCLN